MKPVKTIPTHVGAALTRREPAEHARTRRTSPWSKKWHFKATKPSRRLEMVVRDTSETKAKQFSVLDPEARIEKRIIAPCLL